VYTDPTPTHSVSPSSNWSLNGKVYAEGYCPTGDDLVVLINITITTAAYDYSYDPNAPGPVPYQGWVSAGGTTAYWQYYTGASGLNCASGPASLSDTWTGFSGTWYSAEIATNPAINVAPWYLLLQGGWGVVVTTLSVTTQVEVSGAGSWGYACVDLAQASTNPCTYGGGPPSLSYTYLENMSAYVVYD
jgi:hypothetical protein